MNRLWNVTVCVVAITAALAARIGAQQSTGRYGALYGPAPSRMDILGEEEMRGFSKISSFSNGVTVMCDRARGHLLYLFQSGGAGLGIAIVPNGCEKN